MITLDELAGQARLVGFELAGVAPVEPVGGGWYAPHVARLEAWLAAGFAGEMGYLAERLEERVVPEALLPGVRTAVALWLSHRTPEVPRPPRLTGRVAAYARGRDYHNVARKAGRKLRKHLLRAAPDLQTYFSVDTGPVLERAFGARAGIGWIGRSTMLIHPQLGTFGSLAVLFTDAPLPTAPAAHPDRCGTCTACVDDCPTGAIGPLGVDARRCISYWTIEHRGVIPAEVRPLLGDWLFGCDICQDVCPWNRGAPTADPARWRPRADHTWPDLIGWINQPTATLEATLNGSPFRRAGAAGLRRNALICAANQGATAALPAVHGVLDADPDPVLRATAAWAARALGSHRAAQTARRDPDPQVRREANSPLPPRRP